MKTIMSQLLILLLLHLYGMKPRVLADQRLRISRVVADMQNRQQRKQGPGMPQLNSERQADFRVTSSHIRWPVGAWTFLNVFDHSLYRYL